MKRTVRIVVLTFIVLTLVPIPVTSVMAASSSSQGLSKGEIQISGRAAPAARQVSNSAEASQSLIKNTVEMKNAERAVVVLQTRNNLITVYSGDSDLLYSVSTESGISLAERLTASELKARFPELYDIATGIAWAGMQPMKSDLKR